MREDSRNNELCCGPATEFRVTLIESLDAPRTSEPRIVVMADTYNNIRHHSEKGRKSIETVMAYVMPGTMLVRVTLNE